MFGATVTDNVILVVVGLFLSFLAHTKREDIGPKANLLMYLGIGLVTTGILQMFMVLATK
jgi:hypothetical protein